MSITINQPDTKCNPNPYPTTKQRAILSIQLNLVACPTYPEKFVRYGFVAQFHNFTLLLSHCLDIVKHGMDAAYVGSYTQLHCALITE